MLRELAELVPADWIEYSERDMVARRCLLSHEHPRFGQVFGPFDDIRAVKAEHPLCRRHEEGHFEAMSLSELLAQRELRRTPCYRLVLEPLGISDQLAVAIPSPLRHAKRFFLDRIDGAFSTRDRLMLDL